MTQPPDGQLEVGRIGKPHGVRGDLFVSLTSDLPERRAIGAQFTIVDSTGARLLTIATVRPQQDRWVMHFVGIDDRNDGEKLVNKFLFADPIDNDDALWVHDLIGSSVVDTDGDSWGECTGVVHNPAHEILELSNGLLIPMPFVVSCENGITTIDPPEGLREALLTSENPDE
jgi:16S rRNA processing protein RimM